MANAEQQEQQKTQEEKNREKQQQQFVAAQELAAEKRPDLIHRTLLFLLKQAVMNNRDCRREAEYHEKMLDLKFTEPERLAAEHSAKGETQGNSGDPEGDKPEEHKPADDADIVATALSMPQSQRFSR